MKVSSTSTHVLSDVLDASIAEDQITRAELLKINIDLLFLPKE